VTDPPVQGNGFSIPSDTIHVLAFVRDERGSLIDQRKIEWRLELPDGKPPGDSIATISATGPRIARVTFRRAAFVGVVASVERNDGTTKSGVVYVRWP
jgi:hypothetical protein